MPRSLLLQGMWWRRGTYLAVFAVAAVTMAAAALGPLYARSAGESTLRDQLTEAGTHTGLTFRDEPFGYFLSAGIGNFAKAQARAPRAGEIVGYRRRIPSIDVHSNVAAAGNSRSGVTEVVWRAGACAHVRIVHGHCPTAAGQVMVSARTVGTGYGYRLGGTVKARPGGALHVVGTYVPRDPAGGFWFGRRYFDAHPTVGNPPVPATFDTMFVSQATMRSLPPTTQGILTWDYPLDVSRIRLDDVPVLRREIASITAQFRHASRYRGQPVSSANLPADLQLGTGLVAVLNQAARQRDLVDTGTLLVTLQLTLLAWLVLFQVITDAVEARGNEIALAKLRGLSPAATVRFTLREPLIVLVAAAPVAFLGAWVAAHLFGSAVLAPHTPIPLIGGVGLALGAGLLGGVLATVAGAYRALTRTVLAQWRRTSARAHRSKLALVLDLVLSAAAVAGLIALRARHGGGATGSTAALIAPGLLVVAVALVGTRLLPLLTRVLLRPTRASGRIGLFLAVRQVVRRPAGLRLAALLTVAIGLATFGVCGEAVATLNRAHRAEAEIGADRTVSVAYDKRVDPVAAVRRVDPDGRWAMAAATWLPNGGDSVLATVLGVDPARLAAVGYPAAGGPSTAAIARTVGASAVPEIVVSERRIRARITLSGLSGPAPELQFLFRTADNPQVLASSTALRAGTHDYSAAVHCPHGCTLVGLVWNRPISHLFATMRATMTVRGIDVLRASGWHPLAASLTTPGGWRAGPDLSHSLDVISRVPDGLRDRFHSTSGYGGITYAYVPQPFRAIATYGAVSEGGGAPNPPRMQDAYGSTVTFRVVRHTGVLPVVLQHGLVVNLAYLRDDLPDFDYEANWSVWLGPRAPADAIALLRRAGLDVYQPRSVHARAVELGRQGPALSLFLLLACAIIGAIVAVGGTAIAISASARRRSFETAALRAVGVPSRALYRGGVAEQLLLLGTAVALGVPSGAIAAWVVMPVIPEFGDTTPIRLGYAPPVTPIVLFVLGFCVLVTVTALLAARAVLHAARPARLREGEA